MGMLNPEVSEPLDKMSDVFPEGTRFFLEGVRVVKAHTTDFGEGEMVICKVRGHERELGVWGSYLLAQAKSASPSDFNKWYIIKREVVEGFGKGRPVKLFALAPQSEQMQTAMQSGEPGF